MRSIPPILDPAVVDEIDARLSSVVAIEGVTVPWAIESGSRAWGFPSPDSDYDCRFIFVRPANDYRGLWPQRDVIETPLDKIFDVNGWDLAKAIRLLVKGNATVVEWLRSPIVYSGDEAFRDELLDLAAQVVQPDLVTRHYLHVGRQKWNAADEEMPLKKIFYSLRPAASIRWLRLHEGDGIPPMDLSSLLAESEVSREVLDESCALIELKSQTRELGTGMVPAAIRQFVNEEFALAEEFDSASPVGSAKARDLADEFFVRAVDRYAPRSE